MAGLDARQIRALQQMFAQRADKDDGLVTFRAGRLFIDDQTRMVTADKKRGKIKLLKDEQGLLKFQWFNRISNQKELDLTVFPQSAKWEKVNECTDGRVFVLRMIGSHRKHFFWMQEPKLDKDDEYFTNINKLCNGESISDAKPNTSTSTANQSSKTNSATTNPYAAFSGSGGQDALTQMIIDTLQRGGAGAANNNSTAAAASGDTNANNASGQGNDLMEQMRDMMREQQQAAMEEMKREPDLEDILDPTANEEIIALLDDEKLVEELAQHLPESMRSRSDIIEQLQSPQFQGSLRRLQSAINGPQMPTLLSQMGVQVVNQNVMGVTAFVNAIQSDEKSEQRPEKEQEKPKKEDKIDEDGDTDMVSKDEDKDKDKNNDIDDIYK